MIPGICILVSGYVYAIITFTVIAYQDPSPETAASFNRAFVTTRWIMDSGLLIFLSGLIWRPTPRRLSIFGAIAVVYSLTYMVRTEGYPHRGKGLAEQARYNPDWVISLFILAVGLAYILAAALLSF